MNLCDELLPGIRELVACFNLYYNLSSRVISMSAILMFWCERVLQLVVVMISLLSGVISQSKYVLQ
jgi:hypothetical protein